MTNPNDGYPLFNKGDFVKLSQGWDHLPSGVYEVFDTKAGKYCDTHHNPDFIFPMLMDIDGNLVPVHPAHLVLHKPAAFIMGSADEYEEIMKIQDSLDLAKLGV